jgi:UDP-N-acetylmuramate dehydrogenase
MTNDALAPLAEELRRLGAEPRVEEPLSRHTTFGIGGPAALLVDPPEAAALPAVLNAIAASGVPRLALGLGSNLLVSDEGYPGVVIKAQRALRAVTVGEGHRLWAEASVPLKKVCSVAAGAGLSGLEFAISIPGSVGGAVTMNAGAHGSSMDRVVERVRVWIPGHGEEELTTADLHFAYRSSRVQTEAWMVLGALFHLVEAPADDVRARMRGFMDHRLKTQPVGERNAGSMFKNPVDGKAGALIEAVGGKGWRSGGAHISEKHANFIINDDAATAWDVLTLMRRAREAVLRKFGKVLRPEVRWVGPAPGEAGTSWDNLWLREDGSWPAPFG